MDSLIRPRLFLINRSCGFLCASKAESIRCKFSLGGISFHPNFIVVSFSGCEVSDRIIKIHRADTVRRASVQFLNCQNNPVSLFRLSSSSQAAKLPRMVTNSNRLIFFIRLSYWIPNFALISFGMASLCTRI